tara:strand:+ start:4096 stop:4782 length:687 start_codon:yes stop_codon:yes gene_type:complete
MVSHKHKCIFVHVPKVAGQSIESFFLEDLGLNWESRRPLLLMHNSESEIGPPKLAHLLAEDYVKYHYISQDLFNDYFKFTFVRNPFDRAYSFYKYLGFSEFLSFDDFILNKFKDESLISNYWFIRPQYDYIYSNGNCLVDFIGKFENIQSDFLHVATKLNLEKKLPHKNISKTSSGFKRKLQLISNNFKFLPLLFNKPHSKKFVMSDDSRQILIDFYLKDFKYFNYNY